MSACSFVSATYSASYVVFQPSWSATFHACRWSSLSPRKRTFSELIRVTRSIPSAAEISPRRAASYSADSACERTSVGATSLCSAATSISPAASVSQSTTNRVNCSDATRAELDRNQPSAILAAPMPHIAVNGLNMYYEVHGHGPPLLLLHGGAGSIPAKWVPVLHAPLPRRRAGAEGPGAPS